MSNSFKHKQKGKLNQGLIDYKDVLQGLKDMFDRNNNDWGEFRKAKKDLEEKILDKETLKDIKIFEEEWWDERYFEFIEKYPSYDDLEYEVRNDKTIEKYIIDYDRNVKLAHDKLCICGNNERESGEGYCKKCLSKNPLLYS